jgi:hypothetical protein
MRNRLSTAARRKAYGASMTLQTDAQDRPFREVTITRVFDAPRALMFKA